MKTKRIVSFLLALLLTVTAIPYVSVPVNAVDEAEEIAGTMAVASESFAPGDLNHDGYVNTTDVVMLRRYVADGYGITLDDREADLNGDTYINTTDVVLLRRFIAGGYGVELKPNLPAPGCNHSVKIDAAVEPTCTTTGLTEGKHCEKCGEILVAQQIVPAKGHIEETIPGKNATCVEDGISEGKKCSVCGVVLVAQETIGKRHNYVDGICSVCGKQEATPDEYFTFTLLEDGTYSIGAKAIYKIPAELVIPESYQGQPVTVIEDKAFYPCDNLVSVTIPNSVTSIGEWAFAHNKNLKNVTFSNNLKHIAGRAFIGCESLVSISLPEGVISIGEMAFCQCTKLVDICLPDSITSIGDNAFWDCSSLTDIVIPKGVTYITEFLFNRCSNLKNVTIPDSVTSIDAYAFHYCTSIESITIPDSVTSIGERAFLECASLVSIRYNGTKAQWDAILKGESWDWNAGDYTVYYKSCAHVEETMPGKAATCTQNGLTEGKKCTVCGEIIVAQEVIVAKGHTEVVIPGKDATCTETGLTEGKKCSVCGMILVNQETILATGHNYIDGTCTICQSINVTSDEYFRFILRSDDTYSIAAKDVANMPDEVVIPATYQGVSVTGIWAGGFRNCGNMVRIIIPEGVTFIEAMAFNGCSNLVQISLPSSMQSIDDGAFGDCLALTEFKVDARSNYYSAVDGNLYTKGEAILIRYAMGKKETSFVIPNGVRRIGESAFYNCVELREITIPDSVTSIGEQAFQKCINLSSMILPNSVSIMDEYAFYDCTSLSQITISDNLKTISDYVFSNCTSLKDIIIPRNITTIGKYAFSSCTNLERIDLLGNVISIDEGAFCRCSSLGGFTIPDSVLHIGGYAFAYCSNLESIIIPQNITSIEEYAFYFCGNLKNITILDGMTNISNHVFGNCTGLTNITIPLSVTNIGDCAFANCENLISISYAGTKAQWNKIEKGFDWDDGTGEYIVSVHECKHIKKIDAAVAPTCTTTGLTEGSHCSLCNEILEKQEIIQAKGHTYIEGVCHCGDIDETYSPVTKYTVTFVDHDGTVLKTQANIASGESAIAPTSPFKEGYRFIGWDKEFDNVTSNITVTALYIQQFKVSFVDYNGTVLKEAWVDSGSSAIPPADPSRTGYTFNGWRGLYSNIYTSQTVQATYIKKTTEASFKISNGIGIVGDTISLYVDLSNNSGFVSASLLVDFDENALTLIAVNDLGTVSGSMHTEYRVSPYMLTWENDERTTNITSNGRIVELVFEISPNASEGVYDITLNIPRDGIINANGQSQSFVTVNGFIAVSEGVRDTHKWDKGTVVTEPTENSTGLIVYTCRVCGATKTESSKKLSLQSITPIGYSIADSSAEITVYSSNNGNSNLGDVNRDGYVTNLDRYTLNRFLAGKASLADENATDINRDGNITTDDLGILSKHLANYPGYQNLNDFAVELIISTVTINKSSITLGESFTLSVVSNRPVGDITMNVDVYLNGSAIDHIAGGEMIQYRPVSEGGYSFNVRIKDQSGNEYQQRLDNYLEVNAPTPKLENPVLMYPNLPSKEKNSYPYFDDDFTIKWNDVEGAVSYTLITYLYEDGDWEEDEFIDDITEPCYEFCYEDAGAYVGQYQFEIIAYDKNGNQSGSDYYYFQWGDNDDIIVGMGGRGSTWTLAYGEDDGWIQVDCNSHWEATVSADWITLKDDEGEGCGRIRVLVDENSGDFPRTGTITFTNKYGGEAVFTINQGPDDSSNDHITYPEYGEIIDYAPFLAKWEFVMQNYEKVILFDITDDEEVLVEENVYGSYLKIPKNVLSKGHCYQLTIEFYRTSDSTYTGASSVVFQVEGDSIDYEDIGGGSGTRGDTDNDEGVTSIILTGLVDGAVVDKRDLHLSWEEVLGAYEYNIALRDITQYPDSVDEKNVVKALDIKIDDLSYIISSGKLTQGHSYRLWVAAIKSDGTVLVGKTFKFTVKANANCGTPSTDFNTATIQHTIGDPFEFEGSILANGGTLEYIQITVSEASTGKYCDYAVYDASALGNVSSFNLSNIYNILTGSGSSIQTSGSRYARAGSQPLSLSQAGTRYVITIYARNKGQGSNTIIATKNIDLVAKPYINVYDENGNNLSGKTISVSHSAFSNKKIFVETNMNIAAWADNSKAFSMVLSETKYTAHGTLYTYTIKGTENTSGSPRSGELRIYQSDSGKVASTSTMLASIKVNQSGNPNMPVVSSASIKDGNTTYNLNNDLVLKVGDHNVNNGYTLIVNMSNNASANWTVYTDNFRVARAYRKNGMVYVNANALGTTALYISHKYADSYDDVDPSTLIKICDIIVEKPKNDSQMADELAEAVMIPYLYDYLDAESGYDDISQPLLFILEVMAKGIIGTAEYEISEAIKNSDVGLDGGRDIIHQMVFSEMLGVNDAWDLFLDEFADVADSFKEDYAFTKVEAKRVGSIGTLSENDYFALLDYETGDKIEFYPETIREIWLTYGEDFLMDKDAIANYRGMSQSFSSKSLKFLSQAGKVMGQIGDAVNLAEKFGGYLLLGAMQDEVDALIDSWIAATDDPGLIAELEDYKKVYSSAGGIVWNSFTDSDIIPGLATDAAKQLGGTIITELAKKGIIGEGAKQWVKKHVENGTIGVAIKAICTADSYIMVSNVIAKYMLGVDANEVYTAITNLLVIDPIYRELIEELCAYGDDYYMHDSYINKVKLAAALAKLEYKYCIDIFENDMAIPFNEKKESIQKVIDEYKAYYNTITESLDDFIFYMYKLRVQ